jgi:sentrin-specific protease 1
MDSVWYPMGFSFGFAFLPALNSEQEDDVTEALSPGRPEEVLSDAFKITIRRKDMVTLKGLNWLNDEVKLFFRQFVF